MFYSPFYHATLRKLVASFGTLFSNIYIVKRQSNGAEIERIKVPLAYGPAERYLVRTQEDPQLNRNFSIKLPRMSFEIKSLEYDSNRKLNTLKVNAEPIPGVQNRAIKQYQGVPYKLTIDLSIISKYIDDANQIIEQILPWFTPAFTITVNSIPGMNYKDDIAITLSGLSLNDNYEEDFLTRRDIIWNLSFDIKATFYGPIADKALITKTITDIFNVTNADDFKSPERLDEIARVQRTTTEPTPITATYVDDFGYTKTIQDLDDEGFLPGMRRNLKTGQDVPVARRFYPETINSKEHFGKMRLK